LAGPQELSVGEGHRVSYVVEDIVMQELLQITIRPAELSAVRVPGIFLMLPVAVTNGEIVAVPRRTLGVR
jgi:hypothetical protein